jgi:hypothetical protein
MVRLCYFNTFSASSRKNSEFHKIKNLQRNKNSRGGFIWVSSGNSIAAYRVIDQSALFMFYDTIINICRICQPNKKLLIKGLHLDFAIIVGFKKDNDQFNMVQCPERGEGRKKKIFKIVCRISLIRAVEIARSTTSFASGLTTKVKFLATSPGPD